MTTFYTYPEPGPSCCGTAAAAGNIVTTTPPRSTIGTSADFPAILGLAPRERYLALRLVTRTGDRIVCHTAALSGVPLLPRNGLAL